jgi:hypothetical protein
MVLLIIEKVFLLIRRSTRPHLCLLLSNNWPNLSMILHVSLLCLTEWVRLLLVFIRYRFNRGLLVEHLYLLIQSLMNGGR